jgi:hypothetical protein
VGFRVARSSFRVTLSSPLFAQIAVNPDPDGEAVCSALCAQDAKTARMAGHKITLLIRTASLSVSHRSRSKS